MGASRKFLQVFTNRRMALMLLMGFSSGLPIALAISTLQAWIASEGLDIKTVGAFTLVQLPYQMKFLWAPLLDRLTPPFLGRRRGWMLITQVALVGVIAGLGLCSPKENIGLMAMVAVLLAFVSASQDVVIDAYRVDALLPTEFGSGAAISTLGYRLGMITSSSIALILVKSLGWSSVYLTMACLVSVGIVTTLLSPEPERSSVPRSWKEAIVDPFADFLGRPRVIEILTFVLIYKLADVMALSLSTKFLLDLGFTTSDIGIVSKGFGLIATILGALAGASIMAGISLVRALVYFGCAQAGAVLMFSLLAAFGKNYELLSCSIFLENFTSGMGTAAFAALLMSLCNHKFTATQYALLSALSTLPRAAVGPLAAALVLRLGWSTFFWVSALCAIPGLLLLSRYRHWGLNVKSA